MAKLNDRVNSAKRSLASQPYEDKVRYRGLTLDHFNKSELRKIVEIAMGYLEQERPLANLAGCTTNLIGSSNERFRHVKLGKE